MPCITNLKISYLFSVHSWQLGRGNFQHHEPRIMRWWWYFTVYMKITRHIFQYSLVSDIAHIFSLSLNTVFGCLDEGQINKMYAWYYLKHIEMIFERNKNYTTGHSWPFLSAAGKINLQASAGTTQLPSESTLSVAIFLRYRLCEKLGKFFNRVLQQPCKV